MSKPEMLSREVVASWLDDGIAKDRTLATIEVLHDALVLSERVREALEACNDGTGHPPREGVQRWQQARKKADAAVADLKTKGWVING